jgi:alkylhydroperoxidase family enzyme
VDINSAVGRQAGLNDAKLLAVRGADLSMFTEIERLVIELADALAMTPSDVSEELFSRLRQKFSEDQLLELGAQIAFENYRARLNRLFDVQSDGLYSACDRVRPESARKQNTGFSHNAKG